MTRKWSALWRSPLLWGVLAGLLWGIQTGGGATPRANILIDEVRGLVTIVRPDTGPVTVSAEVFDQIYLTNLAQVVLVFFLLCSVFGWVAWQLARIRPRGQPQPRLTEHWNIYLLFFFIGGGLSLVLFQLLHLGGWFAGGLLTPAIIATGLIGFVLPLFDGVGAFLVWFLRLESVRAPNWETHIPPPRDWVRPLLRDLFARLRARGKGGKKSD